MNDQLDIYLRKFNSIDFTRIKDHPNILIAAGFWEEERYNAAKVFYRFMRRIDDLIDNHKSGGQKFTREEIDSLTLQVNDWIGKIYSGNGDDAEQQELYETIVKFKIPSWPLESFASSMIYDINNEGFATLGSFLEYSKGASLAPASIFVHLAGLSSENGLYAEPAFNVREESLPCAYFSYLVHIIRDFQKDQLNNLNCFADDLIAKHGLSRSILSGIAHGAPIPDGFRNLMREYYELADRYRVLTLNCIERIWPYLRPQYQLSLEIVFALYLMVFEKIDIESGSFTAGELNPAAEETRQQVYKTILSSATLNRSED